MKKNLLKSIATLVIVLPTLVGCNKEAEPTPVAAQCIYNGYVELPDFSESFTLDVEDYKGLEVKANGDYFYINDFKIYDSLYLADVNGDGYRDFCTDFMYTKNSYRFHGYAFYNMKERRYIQNYQPDNWYSYYLGEKDGALIVKEFYGQHDAGSYKAGKNHVRTGTLVSNKKERELVWQDAEFEVHSFYTGLRNVNNGSWLSDLTPDGVRRYICKTGKAFEVYFITYFNGVLTKDSLYANDCTVFQASSAYEAKFNQEKTSANFGGGKGNHIVYYNLTFKEEGVFDIKITIQGVEDVLQVVVDDAWYDSDYNK